MMPSLRLPQAARGILIALMAYGVAAVFSLAIGLSTGFAQAVWPAAGVALGIVLVRGYHVAVGVWIASGLFVLAFLGADAEAISMGMILAAGAIGAGSALQAVLATAVIRRVLSWPSPLDTTRDITVFLACAAVFGSIPNALIGPTTLVQYGRLERDEWRVQALTWWLGDTIGVLVATIVVLALLAEPRRAWRSRFTGVAIPLAIVVLLVSVAFNMAARWDQGNAERSFQQLVMAQANEIQQVIGRAPEDVQAVSSFWDSSEFVSRSEFAQFVRRPISSNAGPIVMGWVPRVDRVDRPQAELDAQRDGLPGFQFMELDRYTNVRPASKRATYFPLYYVEPHGQRELVHGLDYGSNARRLEGLVDARDTGRATISSRITLTGSMEPGVLAIAPIYQHGPVPSTRTLRRERLEGFAIAAYRLETLLGTGIDQERLAGVEYRAVDLNRGGEVLYESPGFSQTTLRSHQDDFQRISERLTVSGVDWKLMFARNVDVDPPRFSIRFLVLGVSVVLVWITAAFLLILTGRTARVEELVAERTSDLIRTEAKSMSVLATAVDGILSIRADGSLETWNPAVESIFGYTPDQLGDLNISDLVGQPQQLTTTDAASALFRIDDKIDEVVRRIGIGRRADGAEFPVEVSIGQHDAGGHAIRIAIVRDITEREQIDRMKREFVSTVSHELRTPLTSIKGSLRLVEAGIVGDVPDGVREMVHLANVNADRLIRIIGDILDLDRITSGIYELEREVHSSVAITRAAVAEITPMAASEGIVIELDEAVDVQLDCDSGRIIQVLTNLLSNAIKHSADGDVIHIDSEQRTGSVRVSVRDQGPGVAPEAAARIFDRFVQADGSDARRLAGTGLGLAIAKSIVEHHGGRIGVTSTVGEGATFWIDLPTQL